MPHKLLLADDSVTIQRVIELTFADEDVQVFVVGDGRQAIDRVRRDRPDIVLADVGMPERDGYEVAAFIKGDPELAHIPVVLLTGAFEPIDEHRARGVGCDGVLVKPFEPQMVINRVRDLLARPRPGRPAAPGGAPPPGAPASPVPAAPAEPTRAAGRDPFPLSQLDSNLAPPPMAEKPQREGESLEEYFDRLDAAFANLGAVSPSPHAPEAATGGEDLRAGLRDLHEAEPRPPQQWTPEPGGDQGAAAVEPPRHEPAPAAPDPAGRWAADLSGDVDPAPQPHLASAFAALLAAEEGQPFEPAAFIAPAAPVADETIDAIVHRVIARMGDESMRQLVIETAERVVREEIERIKRMTAAAGEPHGA
jgi:CheY-like chemotaxis protein